jgi:hypothetical protein
MYSTIFRASALTVALFIGFDACLADDVVRNFGAAETVNAEAPAATVAFGHRRNCCGGDGGFSAAFDAYSTYQPAYYPNYAGYTGPYGAYYPGNYRYMTPNPYGYYQNGWIWGSSGPTYRGPYPVWNSPSGIYDYRYLGWGSYGWGGWGGTGPAGWGYQGGFYW